MKSSGKVGLLVLGLALVVGAGLGARFYFQRLIVRAEVGQVAARRALMESEELVWTLEGECLKDAQRIFAQPEAKAIAASATGPEDAARVETRLRQYLRIRRLAPVWKATERAFLTMTNESRAATNEAAFKAGLRPVDILAEWMTFEGAIDFALMTNVYDNREALRKTDGAVVDTFFAATAPAPQTAKGVRVVEHKDDRIVIDLFGARVIEECIPGRTAEAATQTTSVKISWKSNYNFLRELVGGKKPEVVLEETLVQTDEGYGVEYRDLIAEYLAGGDKQPWATILCSKGALAVGALLGEKSEAAPEKGEKAPDKGEKAPDKAAKHE